MPNTARSHQKGQAPYRPTRQQREMVHSMVTVGINQNKICERLGITNRTLAKHFRRELDLAYVTLQHDSRVILINKAKAGDVQCLIYLNKVLGWHDRPGGDSDVNVNVNVNVANMDNEALRAELAEILTIVEAGAPRRKRLTIEAEAE